MLAVLFKILAAIGVLLLSLIGLLLVTFLIVLFVPITYKITGKIHEDAKEVSVRVRWILGMLRFSLDYSEELTYQVKLLWNDMTTKPKKKATAKEEVTLSEMQNTGETPETAKTEEAHSTEEHTVAKPSKTESKMESTNNILFKIQSICDKIRDIYENINYYLDLIRQDDTKNLLAHCLKVVKSILKSIRPDKLVLDLKFGFEQPDTTGKIYGLLCMLYPYYGKDIHIEPDFEKRFFKEMYI